jgi:hypothetical protein
VRGIRVGAAALAVALVLVAAVWLLPRDGHLPPGRSADFFARKVTWAQGSTLHHGDRTCDVSPSVVHDVEPTSYGVFLRVVRPAHSDRAGDWVLYDGRTQTPVPGTVYDVEVSPDGRYA